MTGLTYTLYHTLGYDEKQYRLKLDYNHAEKTLAVSVDGQSAPWPRLVDALKKQLLIYGEAIGGDYTAHIARHEAGDTIVFNGVPIDFALKLNAETIGTYKIDSKGVLDQTSHRRLTAAEIRRIGTFHQVGPYEQQAPDRKGPENDALLARAKTAVFTDFHTHSSGQISARSLIKVACSHLAFYPVSLMQEAGINTSFQHFPEDVRKEIPRVPFPAKDKPGMPAMVDAIALNALNDAERHLLELRMAMPGDRQSTYSEMEHDAYRFRYPLTKNNTLFADTLQEMANEYVAQSIRHADIAMVGLDNPELLRTMHTTMHTLGKDSQFEDFSMHFMVGIPRTYPLPKIKEMLEKTKILSANPYITGVDLIGYEITKTKEFTDMLDEFCAWANEHRPGFTIRVHAGENDKNLENVKDFLDLAEKYPDLNFRVGHGVHGMNPSTLKQASKNPRLTIESNPDSVIALNNIDCVNEIPYAKMVDNNIPFVIGSDSNGVYGTSAEQLGLAAYYGGLSEKGFEMLQKHQEHLVKQQRAYSAKLAASIPNWDTLDGKNKFVDSLIGQMKLIPSVSIKSQPKMPPGAITAKLKADQVKLIEDIKEAPELASRTPVLVVGANGDRWEKIDAVAKREVTIGIDMLAHVLDPDKTYFTQGRTKPTGLSMVMDRAIASGNADLKEQNKEPFYTLGMLIAPKFTKSDSYKHLTHMIRVSDNLIDLTDELVGHVISQNGVVIAAGGAAFTRDIILKADQRGIRDKGSNRMMFLFSNAKGASQQKSKWLNPDYNVDNGITLVKKMYELNKDLFRPDFDINKVEELYKQSEARVEEYGYDVAADSKDQLVVDAETINMSKRREK